MLTLELREDDAAFELVLCDEHELDELTHADAVVGTTMEPIAIPPCANAAAASGSDEDGDGDGVDAAAVAAAAAAAAAAAPMWYAMDVGGMIQVEAHCVQRPSTPAAGGGSAFDAGMYSLEQQRGHARGGREGGGRGSGEDEGEEAPPGSAILDNAVSEDEDDDDGEEEGGLSSDGSFDDHYDEHGTV
jgi:hypothetical protein